MNTNKLVSSLCYLSVLFAPFILPIVIYFVAKDDVKYHAKRALLSHLIPFLSIIFLIIGIGHFAHGFIWFSLMILVFGGLSFIVMIWNLVIGVKLLID